MAPHPQTPSYGLDPSYTSIPISTPTSTSAGNINVPAIALSLAFLTFLLACLGICCSSYRRTRLRKHHATLQRPVPPRSCSRGDDGRQWVGLGIADSMPPSSWVASKTPIIIEPVVEDREQMPPPAYTATKPLPQVPTLSVSPAFSSPSSVYSTSEDEEAALLMLRSPGLTPPPTPPPPSHAHADGYSRL